MLDKGPRLHATVPAGRDDPAFSRWFPRPEPEVLLFPSTADRAKHYSTSNGVYGDFYGTTIRETKSNYDRYGECNQKIAEVSEQLQIAKACLDGVDYRDAMLDQGQNRPRGPCCYGASLRGKPNCEGRLRMPVCSTPCDFYRPLAPVEWNCGQPLRPCNEKSDPEFTTRRNDYAHPVGPNDENMCNSPVGPGNENKCSSYTSAARDCRQQREPEYLEDHMRRYHPHLAPKPQVLPKVIFGQSFRPASGGAYARGVGSGGGFGVGLTSAVMSSRSNARSQKRPSSPPPVAKKTVLPATSRYNFYRYYGHAGQGAKTSKDFCPKP